MSYNKTSPHKRPPAANDGPVVARAAVATLIASACLGLTACGSANKPAASVASSQEARAAQIQHKEAVDFVRCARNNGVHLPEPGPRNRIRVTGLKNDPHRRTIVNFCYHKVVIQGQHEERHER